MSKIGTKKNLKISVVDIHVNSNDENLLKIGLNNTDNNKKNVCQLNWSSF